MIGCPTITSGIVENNRPTPTGTFGSGVINTGDNFPFVFDKAEEYSYYCTVYPGTTDMVIVS
jgi:hypothetical protein